MSWVIEIWMKRHLVSDSNGNNVNCRSMKGNLYNIPQLHRLKGVNM